MKKLMNIFVLVAAAAMALASCQKPEIENVQPQEFEYKFLIGNADTKATVGETCVEWELGDKVGTYNSKSNNKYSSVTALSPATLSVYAPSDGTTAGLKENEVMYFYYPYASGDEVQKTAVAMSIPTEQEGDDDMPMVSLPVTVTSATTEVQNEYAGEIKFANLGSVIEFNVYTVTDAYASEVVKSVTFEADQALAGAFAFDLTSVDYSDESTLTIADYTETTVVVNAASGLAVGTKEDPAIVRMVVAPGKYAGNIIVKTDAATYTFPISTTKEFKRSAIKPLGLNLESENATRVENAPEAPVSWVLTELANIKTGDQVVIVSTKGDKSYAMSNNNSTSSAPSAVEVTYSNNMLFSAPAENLVWSFKVTDNQYSFYKDSATWLYCTDTNNGVRVGTNQNNFFVLDAESGYLKNVATSRFLGVYNSQDWRCYTNTTGNTVGQTFQFFVKTVGVDTPDIPMTPELAVDPATVEVTAAGGEAEFDYTVTNPAEGVSVSASTDATWISGFSYSIANKVTFTVAENTATEAREAVITLAYTGAESKIVTVKQDAKVPEGMKVDVLTRATTGIEATTYTEWSDKTVTTSSAVYAGQSAGGNDAIQLRSNNNNSGIVTTTSGGYVKKVVVTWNSNTVSGRTLNVYGKNSAYSAADDLYDSNVQGTLLGTIINETSTELEVTGNYQYIGLRSADGAMYLNEIQITWSSEASDAPVVPELSVSPATVEIPAAGGNAEFGYTIINPADGVSVSASTEATWISGFTYSIANKVTFTVAENTSTEAREAVITLSYEGAASKKVTIKQAATESSEPETPGVEGTHYVKVTSEPSDWSGTYLIVYESGNVAFNGGLKTLDAASNTVAVTISDKNIVANEEANAASFTINASGHIQSASGYYIGQTSNANGLKSNATTTYTNTLSLKSDGTVDIVSGGAYLRYNATSGQDRFRYYKSSSYTGQKAIALYKLQ